MILVKMRQNNEIDRRQLVHFDRGVRQPFRGDPQAEVHVIALVQKVRVGEDREATPVDEHGCGADKCGASRRGLQPKRRIQCRDAGLLQEDCSRLADPSTSLRAQGGV